MGFVSGVAAIKVFSRFWGFCLWVSGVLRFCLDAWWAVVFVLGAFPWVWGCARTSDLRLFGVWLVVGVSVTCAVL